MFVNKPPELPAGITRNVVLESETTCLSPESSRGAKFQVRAEIGAKLKSLEKTCRATFDETKRADYINVEFLINKYNMQCIWIYV